MFVIKAVGQQQYAAVEQRGHGAESLKPLQLITVDADAVAFGLVNAAAYDRPIFLPVDLSGVSQRVLQLAPSSVGYEQGPRVLVEYLKKTACQPERLPQKLALRLRAVGVCIPGVVRQQMIEGTVRRSLVVLKAGLHLCV